MQVDRREEKTVIVLGLARSGTSVVAGMLKSIGVAMGPSVYDDANPLGSFEDRDFQQFHKQIFAAIGADRTYWNPPSLEEILKLKADWAAAIERLVARKSAPGKIWGWKHARTLLTVDLFLPYVHRPHFVAVFRNPLDIAKSSVELTRNYRSDKVDLLGALKIAAFYYGRMANILETHRGVPALFVAFEDIVSRPLREAQRMCDFLGLELTEGKRVAVERLVIPRAQIAERKRLAAGFFTGKVPRLIRNYSLRFLSRRKGA
ncbi:MAG TPA: sulfotransferase [Candidatus Acidoferrales bacterium]|nr:sulfotransferase [Candidatus Acidoferrales bacterium]